MALEVAVEASNLKVNGASNQLLVSSLQGSNKKTILTMKKEKRLQGLNKKMKIESVDYTNRNYRRKK